MIRLEMLNNLREQYFWFESLFFLHFFGFEYRPTLSFPVPVCGKPRRLSHHIFLTVWFFGQRKSGNSSLVVCNRFYITWECFYFGVVVKSGAYPGWENLEGGLVDFLPSRASLLIYSRHGPPPPAPFLFREFDRVLYILFVI